jgi:hypothetical protein
MLYRGYHKRLSVCSTEESVIVPLVPTIMLYHLSEITFCYYNLQSYKTVHTAGTIKEHLYFLELSSITITRDIFLLKYMEIFFSQAFMYCIQT